jgi:hypothetical protein
VSVEENGASPEEEGAVVREMDSHGDDRRSRRRRDDRRESGVRWIPARGLGVYEHAQTVTEATRCACAIVCVLELCERRGSARRCSPRARRW